MRDEQDRPAALSERGDDAEALSLEALVPDREHLVEQQHVCFEERRDRKPQPHRHPGRVRPHRAVDRVLELRERDDLVEPLADARSGEPLQCAVQLHVLPPGEVGMEARTELEQRADPSAGRDTPGGRPDDPGDQTEERRLPGAVPPHEPDGLPGGDRDGDVPERPDLLRTRPAARDDELLERVRVACADDEPARDAVDRDLACAHLSSYAATAASSRRTIPASSADEVGVGVRHLGPLQAHAELSRALGRLDVEVPTDLEMVGDEPDRTDDDVVDAPAAEVVEVSEDVGPEPGLSGRRLALKGERPVVDPAHIRHESARLEQSVPVGVSGVEDPRGKRVGGEDDVGRSFPSRVADTAGEQLDERGVGAPLPDEARLHATAGRGVELLLVPRDGQRGPVGCEDEADEKVTALRDRGVDRGGDPRLPVAHPCEHGRAELVLQAGAGQLGDRVERRHGIRVVDPERAIPGDEVIEVIGADRAATADVCVVGGDVGEPVGRAICHQDHGRVGHAATVASVRSWTSAARRVRASGSVSGRTP